MTASEHYEEGVRHAKTDLAAALKSFDQAIELDPDFAAAYNYRGSAYYFQGKYAEAASSFAKAAELDTALHHAVYNHGLAIRKLGRIEESIVQFRKAIALKPDFFKVYFDLGHSLSMRGRYHEALQNYDNLLENSSATAEKKAYAYHNKGNIYWKLGDLYRCKEEYHRACNIYEYLINQSRQDEDIYTYYSEIMLGIFGDLEKAETMLVKGLKIYPQSHRIMVILGELYGILDKDWKSIDSYRQAERLLVDTSTDENSSISLAYVKAKLEYFAEAEKILLMLLEKNDQNLDVFHMAMVYEGQGQYQRAYEYFRRSFNQDPGNIHLRFKLAEVYFKLNKLELAEKELVKIESCSPEHIFTLVALAQLYATKGASDDEEYYLTAEKYLSKAVSLIATDRIIGFIGKRQQSQLFYARGYVRIKLQSIDLGKRAFLPGAIADFKKAVQLDPVNNTAQRALSKLKRIRPILQKGFLERTGQGFIVFMCVIVCVLTQLLYATGKKYWC